MISFFKTLGRRLIPISINTAGIYSVVYSNGVVFNGYKAVAIMWFAMSFLGYIACVELESDESFRRRMVKNHKHSNGFASTIGMAIDALTVGVMFAYSHIGMGIVVIFTYFVFGLGVKGMDEKIYEQESEK